MASDSVKLKVTGIVGGNYYDEDDKRRTIRVYLEPEKLERFEEILEKSGFKWSGDSYPVKTDSEDNPYIKVTSKFDVQCKGLPEGYMLSDVGKESECIFRLNLKEGAYRQGKTTIKYVACYLTALEVNKFVELVPYDAFEDESYSEL